MNNQRRFLKSQIEYQIGGYVPSSMIIDNENNEINLEWVKEY